MITDRRACCQSTVLTRSASQRELIAEAGCAHTFSLYGRMNCSTIPSPNVASIQAPKSSSARRSCPFAAVLCTDQAGECILGHGRRKPMQVVLHGIRNPRSTDVHV